MRSKLLTVDDICETFGVSKSTAYKISKEMPHIKVGRRILIPKHEVVIYIKKHLKQK
jgi:excisionase family DNA binding protein